MAQWLKCHTPNASMNSISGQRTKFPHTAKHGQINFFFKGKDIEWYLEADDEGLKVHPKDLVTRRP